MRLLSILVALAIGSNAHAGLSDYLPSVLRRAKPVLKAPPPIAPQTNAIAKPAEKRLSDFYTQVDKNEIIEAKKRIAAAVEEALTNPVAGRSESNPLLTQVLNDNFFELYNKLYEGEVAPSLLTATPEQNEHFRQLEMINTTSRISLPYEIATAWTSAMIGLDKWAQTGRKPPKIDKPNINNSAPSFFIDSNPGVLKQAVDGFTNALNAELERNQDKKFQQLLLATIVNYMFFSEFDVRYSERVLGILSSNNETSTFVGTKISIAATHLAALNTVESWIHVLLAYSSGNMRIMNYANFTHDFLYELLFNDVTLTPEKTEALNSIRKIIKQADVPGADKSGYHSANGIKERLIETIDENQAKYEKNCQVKVTASIASVPAK